MLRLSLCLKDFTALVVKGCSFNSSYGHCQTQINALPGFRLNEGIYGLSLVDGPVDIFLTGVKLRAF